MAGEFVRLDDRRRFSTINSPVGRTEASGDCGSSIRPSFSADVTNANERPTAGRIEPSSHSTSSIAGGSLSAGFGNRIGDTGGSVGEGGSGMYVSIWSRYIAALSSAALVSVSLRLSLRQRKPRKAAWMRAALSSSARLSWIIAAAIKSAFSDSGDVGSGSREVLEDCFRPRLLSVLLSAPPLCATARRPRTQPRRRPSRSLCAGTPTSGTSTCVALLASEQAVSFQMSGSVYDCAYTKGEGTSGGRRGASAPVRAANTKQCRVRSAPPAPLPHNQTVGERVHQPPVGASLLLFPSLSLCVETCEKRGQESLDQRRGSMAGEVERSREGARGTESEGGRGGRRVCLTCGVVQRGESRLLDRRQPLLVVEHLEGALRAEQHHGRRLGRHGGALPPLCL